MLSCGSSKGKKLPYLLSRNLPNRSVENASTTTTTTKTRATTSTSTSTTTTTTRTTATTTTTTTPTTKLQVSGSFVLVCFGREFGVFFKHRFHSWFARGWVLIISPNCSFSWGGRLTTGMSRTGS